MSICDNTIYTNYTFTKSADTTFEQINCGSIKYYKKLGIVKLHITLMQNSDILAHQNIEIGKIEGWNNGEIYFIAHARSSSHNLRMRIDASGNVTAQPVTTITQKQWWQVHGIF